MANLFVWLLAAVAPLAKKVLLALGIGWLSYEGLSMVGTQINGEVVAIWGQVGGDQLKMASLLGIPQALGILLGGVAGRISLAVVGKLGKIVS